MGANAATGLSYVGIALEVTPGTGLAPQAFIPVTSRQPFDNLTYLEDKGMRGSMVEDYGEIAGVRHSEWDLGGDVFADTIGWAAMGVLGDVVVSTGRTVTDGVTNTTTTVTSATAAFNAADVGRAVTGTDIPAATTIASVTNATTIVLSQAATGSHSGNTLTIGTVGVQVHAGAVKNTVDGQPKSYTLTDFYGSSAANPARRYAGQKFSDFGLKWQADQMLTWTSKSLGFASSQQAKPTQSFTNVAPEPAWEIFTTIAGVAIGYCEGGEVNFKRNVSALNAAAGSQDPYKVQAGTLMVTGKLTLWLDTDDTELIRYLTNTQPSLDLNAAHGSGVTAVGVNIHATKCAYVVGKPNYGKDAVQYDIDTHFVANTTDVGASAGYGPCKVNLTNAVASGTYA